MRALRGLLNAVLGILAALLWLIGGCSAQQSS